MDGSNPCGCLNGGTCVAYEEVICECPNGFQGSRCGDTTIDFDFSQKIDKNEINLAVVVIVTSFVTSIILAGLYLIYRRCKKKKKMTRTNKYGIDQRLYEWRADEYDPTSISNHRPSQAFHTQEELNATQSRRLSERRTSKATVVICFNETAKTQCNNSNTHPDLENVETIKLESRKTSVTSYSRTPRRKRSLGLSR